MTVQLRSRISHPFPDLSTSSSIEAAAMAKHEADSIEKREKKEKKDKKRKHSESLPADTAEDAGVEVVSERKKKDKKRKSIADTEGDITMDSLNGNSEVVKLEDDEEEEKEQKKDVAAVAAVRLDVPLAALVPFANPLCDDKAQKKVLKGVKKGMSFHPSFSNSTPLKKDIACLTLHCLRNSTN